MSEERLSRWLTSPQVALPLLLAICMAQIGLAYLAPRVGALAAPHQSLLNTVPGGLLPLLALTAAGAVVMALILQGAVWLFMREREEMRRPFTPATFAFVILALFSTLMGSVVRELLGAHGTPSWITYVPDFLNVIVIVLFAIRGRLALERRGVL